ncbi:MAG: MBL fold metallo-hydrolase [Proteobacteria bacterium]|nr:MBL fold metallo-hydrolase [Pseudomonadota bacterium]
MKKLTDNVFLLGNRHFNYFMVGERETAIVECGVTGGVVSLEAQWSQLESKPNVKYLVAMHAHFDHVCGIPRLREFFPQAQVLASEKAQKVLAKPKIVTSFFDQDGKMSETLVRDGILSMKSPPQKPTRIEVDQIIRDGDVIELANDVKLEVMAAPGHSPCSVACYLPQDRVMFLSDAGGFQISDEDIFPIFFQGYDRYVQTNEILMGFPTRALGLPHGTIWGGDEVNLFYQRALESARTAFDSIRTMVNDGIDEETMKGELFSRYYRGALRIYTPENIDICLELLIRRVKECL